MHNPARIPVVLETLKETWEKYPDLRLGQLISILGIINNKGTPDIFYVEDEDLVNRLIAFQFRLKK